GVDLLVDARTEDRDVPRSAPGDALTRGVVVVEAEPLEERLVAVDGTRDGVLDDLRLEDELDTRPALECADLPGDERTSRWAPGGAARAEARGRRVRNREERDIGELGGDAVRHDRVEERGPTGRVRRLQAVLDGIAAGHLCRVGKLRQGRGWSDDKGLRPCGPRWQSVGDETRLIRTRRRRGMAPPGIRVDVGMERHRKGLVRVGLVVVDGGEGQGPGRGVDLELQ